MVFDFLGSVFKKKRVGEEAREVPVKGEKEKLGTSDVLEWLNSQLARDMLSERETFSSISQNLTELLKDLRKNVESVRKKGFESGDRTYAAINMIKDTWAKKAMMSLSAFGREAPIEKVSPERIDFPVFRDLFHSAVRLMDEISMIPKQKMVLKRYFEKESRRMSEILKSTGLAMDEMKARIDAAGTLKSMDKIKRTLSRFAESEKEAHTLRAAIDGTDSDIRDKEKELDALEKRIEIIEKKPEWKELDELGRRAGNRLETRERIESDIAGKLGSMKRVFKIYAHDALELTSEEKKLLLDLSHSPLKTFLSRDAEPVGNLLEKLGQDIENGTFRLSKKDLGKTDELKDALQSDWLSKIKSQHAEAAAEAGEAKKRMDEINVAVEKRGSERMLEKSRVELDMLRRDKSEREKKLAEKRHALEEMKKEISDSIRKELGREVELS